MVFSDIRRVIETVAEHNKWRNNCINLIASENVMSPIASRVYLCDFMHRYAEGEPGARYYQGTKYIDEIESFAIELVKEIFRAKYADVRPISGTLAVLAVLRAFAKPGDSYVAPSVSAGAHISQAEFGAAGTRGLKVHYIPLDVKNMNLDVEKGAKIIREAKPKLINTGGSVFLFPHPLKELKEVAEEVGAVLTYDASHVLGLIAGGEFQDPLREGAEVVMSSTHKTLPGPQGGLVFSSNEKYKSKISRAVFPGLVANHHLHRLPALVVTLLEIKEFGKELAKNTVKNAKKLAESLYERGFDVMGEKQGFTKSHQVLVNVRKQGGGKYVAEKLERANIIVNKQLLPWEPPEAAHNPAGIRIGVQEMTRYGMDESDMEYVAELIKRVVIDNQNPDVIREEVIKFRSNYQILKYCFQPAEYANLLEQLRL